MQWLIAKTNKMNKMMLKAEDVSILMKLETRSYYMLKFTYKCSVCRLQDEIASALHWAVHGHAKKRLAYTLNLPRKLRTHPVFYVVLLKPYHDPSLVD